MKIRFLGTGAADWPLERTADNLEFRRLSSAIIDDRLLIDPGPHVLQALAEYEIPLTSVRYVLNTHRHGDHFSADTLSALIAAGAQFVELSAGETKSVGEYTVHAYAGNHGTCENALHYLISRENRSIFYGLDGAWLLYDEIRGIQTHKPDLAVLDATIGFQDGDYRIFEHNNLNMVLEMQKTLSPYVGHFCISHMARTLHTDHASLEKAMAAHRITAAHDGLVIDLT